MFTINVMMIWTMMMKTTNLRKMMVIKRIFKKSKLPVIEMRKMKPRIRMKMLNKFNNSKIFFNIR